jgi:hypothetical protein
MHKEKSKGMFIIQIGAEEMKKPNAEIKEYKEEDYKEKNDKEKSFTISEFGGYTPQSLVKKLEDVKEFIAAGKTREALMSIDSCIVRLTKRELPEMKDDDPFTTIEYQLDEILPNQGKGN